MQTMKKKSSRFFSLVARIQINIFRDFQKRNYSGKKNFEIAFNKYPLVF